LAFLALIHSILLRRYSAAVKTYPVQVLPTSFFFDCNGIIRYARLGAMIADYFAQELQRLF
jgi:hypothetical protein